RVARVGGTGGFDYVYADTVNRRLYVPRTGPGGRVTVYDLDRLDSVGTIANTNARGVAVDVASGHGYASSKPLAMWDARTLAPMHTVDVQGGPDGILADPFNGRIWVFSHGAPNATVVDGATGAVVGTVDLGGAPEQAVSDGRGHLYVDIEDKDNIAVVDARTLAATTHYDLAGRGGTCAGLAFDVANRVLFATCRNPATMVALSADDGHVITTLPIGVGTDGAAFNPATREVFSSNGDGTLTIVRENTPTDFVVAQTVRTTPGAKTLTLDARSNRVLLIAAEYGPPTAPPPAGAPPGRPNRGPMVPGSFAIWVVGR
ncbi:MAG TPA: hypothetical protein VGD56_01915, partial [Gemmatirosa sp.]